VPKVLLIRWKRIDVVRTKGRLFPRHQSEHVEAACPEKCEGFKKDEVSLVWDKAAHNTNTRN
jgi:hypothetical protein